MTSILFLSAPFHFIQFHSFQFHFSKKKKKTPPKKTHPPPATLHGGVSSYSNLTKGVFYFILFLVFREGHGMACNVHLGWDGMGLMK